MAFALEVLKTARAEEPGLCDAAWAADVDRMLDEAVAVELAFAEDVLAGGMAGLSLKDMREYLDYVADQRRVQLGLKAKTGAKNPIPFMDLQDVQGLTKFFERRVSAYRVGVEGDVAFDEAF